MQQILARFCHVLGQSVSVPKSIVFASPSVSTTTKAAITRITGISFTNNLGTYLGVPLINDPSFKDDF